MKNVTSSLFGVFIGVVAGAVGMECTVGRERKKSQKKTLDQADKLQEFYTVLLQWIRVHQSGRKLVSYFEKNDYKTVAIYGMKELGESLLAELDGSNVVVKYAVDRDATDIYSEIDVLKPSENLEPVDVMVITAIHAYNAIENDMKQKLSCPIVSIEDVVWEA